MQVNVEILEAWFADFNSRYFGGSLPVPMFAVGRSRSRLGTMSCKVKHGLFSKSFTGYTIRLSNYYDAEENHFKNVLLHEMIHLSIISKRIKDTSPHGEVFRRIMHAINADGWNISVSKRMDKDLRRMKSNKVKTRIVLGAVMADGRHILSVVNNKYVKALDRVLDSSKDIKAYAWYVSDDEYFAEFPVVRSAKGRIVPAGIYMELKSRMRAFKP